MRTAVEKSATRVLRPPACPRPQKGGRHEFPPSSGSPLPRGARGHRGDAGPGAGGQRSSRAGGRQWYRRVTRPHWCHGRISPNDVADQQHPDDNRGRWMDDRGGCRTRPTSRRCAGGTSGSAGIRPDDDGRHGKELAAAVPIETSATRSVSPYQPSTPQKIICGVDGCRGLPYKK